MIKFFGRTPSFPRPPVLYHVGTAEIHGFIRPEPNWTCTRGEYGNFVFAGSSLEAAYGYAMKTAGCFSSGPINSAKGEVGFYSMFKSRDAFYAENPKGFIHPVDPKLFDAVPTEDGLNSGEWIARSDVPVDPAKTIPVRGIEEAMEKGVQFFFLTREPTAAERTRLETMDTTTRNFAEEIKGGLLSWENRERGIRPLPAIQTQLNAAQPLAFRMMAPRDHS